MNSEYTPERISELKDNEIFVFGSNLVGFHGGGAARLAYDRFGTVAPNSLSLSELMIIVYVKMHRRY